MSMTFVDNHYKSAMALCGALSHCLYPKALNNQPEKFKVLGFVWCTPLPIPKSIEQPT